MLSEPTVDGKPLNLRIIKSLTLIGRVNRRAATVDAFREGTVGALDTPCDIVLDLTKLTFMDSSGLQAVVALAQRVDGGVVLRCLPPNVLRVLDTLSVNGAVGIRIES